MKGVPFKMNIMDYIKGLNFNAICYKLAQYEIGGRLYFGDKDLRNEIQLAGSKRIYLNKIAKYYFDTFGNEKAAMDWFEKKDESTIESFLLEFYCAY